MFVASLGAATMMATEFVPAEDRGEFLVIVELPPGTSFDQSVTTVSGVERSLLEIPEVTQVFSTVGVNGQTRGIEPAGAHDEEGSAGAKHRGNQGTGRMILADIPFVDGKVADPEFMQGAPDAPY